MDFEHERREEVIQWIYETYGRTRSALTAVVSRYRSRGAAREVGDQFGGAQGQAVEVDHVHVGERPGGEQSAAGDAEEFGTFARELADGLARCSAGLRL